MSFNHPRRTTKTASSALTPSCSSTIDQTASGRLTPLSTTVKTNMSLRKGSTFHSPSTPDSEIPHPLFRVPSLPRRSQTTLEDVVDAHRRRVALTLGDIDRSLASVEEDLAAARLSFRDTADPVPQSFLAHTVGTPSLKTYGSIMDSAIKKEAKEALAIGRHSLRPRQDRRPSRYSDSALGSSIGSSINGKKAAAAGAATETLATSIEEEGPHTKTSVAASAITRSAAHASSVQNLPRLSSRASNRIQEHILRPLLAKPSLKDFQSIVKDCPRRIHAKEIVCLRDLEKTLIFMAPERAKTAALYLDFCLTSIRCIQATVEFLNEREQTRPHDRPYTDGYFVDLVDQIKQYASQVQVAKEKESKGEPLDEMDPESTDEIRLHGGLTKNGRPAELVRVKKNGKAVSVATGLPVDMDEDSKDFVRFKRSLSQEAEDDEAIMRSMARRKRSASAAELAPKRCREPGCDKEFKRPCDLTKHEKTHSRPWKCPEDTCKYHEYGWPTEKEMDRHHNDKHSSAPALYECHFKPCPYRSKRESNCKQHMEKAHGWEYVRSKNNGKARSDKPSGSVINGMPTPQLTDIRTPSSDGNNGAATPDGDDVQMHLGFDESVMYDNRNALNFPVYNHDFEMFPPQHISLDFSPVSEMHQSRSLSASSDGHSPFMVNDLGEDHFAENFHAFNNTNELDFLQEEDLYSARVQLPTPTHDVFTRPSGHSVPFETSGLPFQADPIPHISPIGQGNTMLYTPTSLKDVDEGFEDFIPQNHHLNNSGAGDFQLFPSSVTGSGTMSSAPSALFGEMPKGFAGVSAQDLLDFYAASTAAATANQHHNFVPTFTAINQNANMNNMNNMNMSMDWSDDQFNGYRSH